MVETDTVERVQERKAALNLVRFDHRLQNVMDGQGLALAGEVVGDCKNGAEVVRRMSPLGCKEAIIVVEPPNLGTNVERAADGVELEVRAGNLRACRLSSH